PSALGRANRSRNGIANGRLNPSIRLGASRARAGTPRVYSCPARRQTLRGVFGARGPGYDRASERVSLFLRQLVACFEFGNWRQNEGDLAAKLVNLARPLRQWRDLELFE